MSGVVAQRWIAKFWRRIAALFIDMVILAAIGCGLGLLLEPVFVSLAGWGRLVGLVISLSYFGVQNSRLCGGQTIGKKALDIRVVDGQNRPVSLGRSLARAAILVVPFSLNGAMFPVEVMSSLVIYPLSLVIFGGLFSCIYLYVCNRRTRQSLHDLLVGTYVVSQQADYNAPGSIWFGHIIVVSLLLLAAAAAPYALRPRFLGQSFNELLVAQRALAAEADVDYVSVSVTSKVFVSPGAASQRADTVDVVVFLSESQLINPELARHFAEIVWQNFPPAADKDALNVVLVFGFDIGIWSQWSRYAYGFSPAELSHVQ